jgi:hypothetical protein
MTLSRRNSTMTSMPLAAPEGFSSARLMERRTMSVTMENTRAATSHSMNTCLVTEKSIPPIVGR